MNTENNTENTSMQALFHAPMWGAKSEGIAVMIMASAIASLVVGIVIAATIDSFAPAMVGIALAVFLYIPANRLRKLTNASLDEVYRNRNQVVSSAPVEQGGTIVFLPRTVKVNHDNVPLPRSMGGRDVKVDGKPSDVKKVLDFIHSTGKTSRNQVIEGTGISQGAWKRIMDSLEKGGLVTKSKNGYTLSNELDYALDSLDAQLE